MTRRKTGSKLKLLDSLSDPPPRPLGEHGLNLWKAILAENAFPDAAGRETLALACAALDTAEACAAQVRADGAVIKFAFDNRLRYRA